MKFRKIFMVLIVLLWCVAGITVIFQLNKDDEMEVVEVFSQINCQSMQAKYIAEGRLDSEYLTASEQKEMLEQIAKGIGITKNYEIVSEDMGRSRIVSLNKESGNADVQIQILTYEDEVEDNTFYTRQYIKLSLSLFKYVDEIIYLRNEIEKVLANSPFDCNGNLQFEAQFAHELSFAQKNKLSKDFLSKISAKSVSEQKDTDLYTIYAYTDLIPDYKLVDGDAVNVNLVFNYDEEKNITRLYMATPYIIEEF